jgi:glyoxylase-like metal-dependent hydrolase (beta-lactamase superfamily II)
MHGADADMVARGEAFRKWKPAPGLRNWWFARTVVKHGPGSFDPVSVEHRVAPGETIPVAGGIKAIWTPGHSAGHLVFLWPHDGGVLFTGDVANNVRGLGGPPIYEDRKQALESLRNISNEKFRVACFAHGEPIVGNASGRFRAKNWF